MLDPVDTIRIGALSLVSSYLRCNWLENVLLKNADDTSINGVLLVYILLNFSVSKRYVVALAGGSVLVQLAKEHRTNLEVRNVY